MTLAERLLHLRFRIDQAVHQAGRSAGSAQLVAVSKTHPPGAIQQAMALGQLHFGESYAQELRDKAPVLPPELRWHFIGRIQRNKIKYIAPHAYRVHGLTHVDQAIALAKRAPGPLKVLLNIKLGGESSKVGTPPAQLSELADAVSAVDGVELVGLMCIPPFTEDPADSAPYFAELAELQAQQCSRGHAMTELSMGMSRDFPHAIAHGATWVRVGTAIFGPRESRT